MTQSNPFNPPFTRLENLLHSAVGTPQWREGLDWSNRYAAYTGGKNQCSHRSKINVMGIPISPRNMYVINVANPVLKRHTPVVGAEVVYAQNAFHILPLLNPITYVKNAMMRNMETKNA